MLDKPTASHTLGLDLDDFSLKGAAVSFSGNSIKIDELFDYFTETDNENVKRLYIEEEKTHLNTLRETHLFITAAETKDVLVRPLDITLTKNKDINAALHFQVEPLLPYPLDQAVIDKILLSKDKEGSSLSFLSFRKDHLLNHLKAWEQLGVNSEIVSAAPQAIALFANFYSDSEKPAFIVHIGIENAFCILLDQKKLIAAQSIFTGIRSLLSVYSEESHQDFKTTYHQLVQGELSLNSENFLKGHLKDAVETLRLNVTRTIYALAKSYKERQVEEIMFTGPGALLNGFIEEFSTSLNMTLRTHINSEVSSNEYLLYALPIGLGLSGLPNSKDQINFRQQEFAYPEPWKWLKKPILQYFAWLFLAAVTLAIFGTLYTYHQEGEVKRQYLELLKVMNKPYQEFENEYSSKINGKKDISNTQILSLSKLSSKDIENRLGLLEKDLNSTPQTFPLKPNVPLVSDILAWIINQFNALENKQTDGENSFHIESFSYTMVKRPEPTKKQEKYQIKVELEFSSLKPKLAREFHDILIALNEFVDPKGEIKWGSNRDRYRTSFFLKDKTAYPN